MGLLYLACPRTTWEQTNCIELLLETGDQDRGFIPLCDRDQLATLTFDSAEEDRVLVSIDTEGLRDLLRARLLSGERITDQRLSQIALAAVRAVEPLQLSAGRAVLPPSNVLARSASASFDAPANGWVKMDESDNFTIMIGPLWARSDREGGRYGFLATDKHLNRNGVVHGGMLLTFADKAMGLTAWEAGGRPSHATIQLETRFIRAVTRDRFVEARCRIIRQARALAFVEATLVTGDTTVVEASGIWTCTQGSEYRNS
jgi:uncharacterized protein (TIGR00369 family)